MPPTRAGWQQALQSADFTVAFSMFDDESTKHGRRRLPAPVPRREGGHRHPPGRPPPASALRPPTRPATSARSGRSWSSSPRPSATRPASLPPPMPSRRSPTRSPFYAGITHEEIGGRGIRWQERSRGEELPAPAGEAARHSPQAAQTVRVLRPRTRAAPAPRHLPGPVGRRHHRAESGAALSCSPSSGSRWRSTTRSGSAWKHGDEVEVSVNGHSIRARRGRVARADAARRRLPDRGHRRGQRKRPAQRRRRAWIEVRSGDVGAEAGAE